MKEYFFFYLKYTKKTAHTEELYEDGTQVYL